jgi:hypothetical protein
MSTQPLFQRVLEALSPGVKRLVVEAVSLRMNGAVPPLPHIFIAGDYLIKHRDNFNVYLNKPVTLLKPTTADC